MGGMLGVCSHKLVDNELKQLCVDSIVSALVGDVSCISIAFGEICIDIIFSISAVCKVGNALEPRFW